jgi:hypothetical protein
MLGSPGCGGSNDDHPNAEFQAFSTVLSCLVPFEKVRIDSTIIPSLNCHCFE